MAEHVKLLNFSPTGRVLPSVSLPLSKSQVALKIYDRIAKGDPGFSASELVALDSGTLSLDVVRKLFSAAALERAVRERLASADLSKDEREQLLAILGDKNNWRASQGGPEFYDRFGIRRYDAPKGARQDSFGGHADRGEGGDPEGKSKITKSMVDREAARSLAKSAGFRVQQMSGETMHMIHPARPGETLAIDPRGAWEHGRRGMAAEQGEAGELARHLGMD